MQILEPNVYNFGTSVEKLVELCYKREKMVFFRFVTKMINGSLC